MSPRRTRSGKLISPLGDDLPSSSRSGGKVPIGRPKPKRRLAIPARARNSRTRGAVIGETDENAAMEVNDGQELILQEDDRNSVGAADLIEDEPTTIEVGDDNGDAIEIASDPVNDSVIDLTDEPRVMSSPIRLGSHWQNSQSFLARVPPNPWRYHPPRPIQPPIMVDLTDSPASKVSRPDVSLDLTDSPECHGGGVSVQCPVCLESLSSIKRSGCDLLSTVCGHIFCSRCLPASLKASGKCPSCRRRIGAKEFHKIFI